MSARGNTLARTFTTRGHNGRFVEGEIGRTQREKIEGAIEHHLREADALILLLDMFDGDADFEHDAGDDAEAHADDDLDCHEDIYNGCGRGAL
ncbi:MAG TPA: hypothetical protein VGG10_15110 [Rhizomicrobium sp.]|jgi:hypothetical protein